MVGQARSYKYNCRAAWRACSQSHILQSGQARGLAGAVRTKGHTKGVLHAIGPKRQMPGGWGQSPHDVEIQ